jgi:hypothetical protein
MAASQAFFRELQSDKDNFQCFDCNRNGAQWASINNSIFLCFDCSSAHRSMGVHLSFVRSTTMDSWSPHQLTLMSIGGNRRLREFMELFSLPSRMDVYEKYSCRALEYYRAVLKCESENRLLAEPPPSTAQGREAKMRPPPPRPSYTSLASRPYQPEPEAQGWLGSAKSLVGSALDRASEGGFLEGIKNATVTAIDYSKELGGSIVDRIGTDSLKNIGQKSVDVLTTVGGMAYDSAQMAINRVKGKKNEYLNRDGNGEVYRRDEYRGQNGYYQPPSSYGGGEYGQNRESYGQSRESYGQNRESYGNYSSDKLNAERNSGFFLANRR